MKKILAALLVASFGAGLMAQDLVYDYKASIKRLDAQFTVKKDKTAGQFVAASYKVASDVISGYVVLPACQNCKNGTITSTLGNAFTDTAYLVRKSDVYSKKNAKPYVLVTPVKAKAALFGAYTQSNAKNQDGTPDSSPKATIKAANKAWMALEYNLPDGNENLDISVILPKSDYAGEGVSLGFLGLTNQGYIEAPVKHTGFGAATSNGASDKPKYGLCADDVVAGWTCQWVTSISGTLVGYPAYAGPCGKTPMWDVCYPTNTAKVEDGVISGTWTLKYNQKVTGKYNEATDKAGYILGLLKAKAADVINKNYKTSSSSNAQ